MARVSGVGSDAGGHVIIHSSDVQGGMASGRPCCCSRRISHGASSSSGFSSETLFPGNEVAGIYHEIANKDGISLTESIHGVNCMHQLDVGGRHGASRVRGASHGRCHGRDVALATVVSCGPKFKLDGAEVASEFWVVHVDMALLKTEDLVRSRKNRNTLGNAEKTKIAWPSTFIRKIYG